MRFTACFIALIASAFAVPAHCITQARTDKITTGLFQLQFLTYSDGDPSLDPPNGIITVPVQPQGNCISFQIPENPFILFGALGDVCLNYFDNMIFSGSGCQGSPYPIGEPSSDWLPTRFAPSKSQLLGHKMNYNPSCQKSFGNQGISDPVFGRHISVTNFDLTFGPNKLKSQRCDMKQSA
ncbi:hypothetical protein C8F04DRAFT_1188094 [Mycena alexandri]|uniref:Uncharacterized protein n=1 Tax=Mycena alexandri TaxID=1745969 RepID=A0AAD6SNL4_9AGAR|nr:hypothetical protein C8F04DRAFT_1188094 [Mycena alexandri]